MKKKDREEILGVLETLHLAQKKYGELITAGDFGQADMLLSECQESAVGIGEFIEQTAPAEEKMIHLLEAYCEELFQVGSSNRILSPDIQQSRIAAVLCAVKEAVSGAGKREIVFFPYKASMWDSLESIWLAAKKNSTFECYVVPIPYFTKDKNGNFNAMFYEGDLFPADVPVVDWQNYKLEEHDIAAAVIHNPYDNTNKVTSVHPYFYAKELKKKAELLIYCPYFVTTDMVKEDQCITPGTLHADYVFLQSEYVRKEYIRIFSQFEKENGLENLLKKPEEKFIASGSPKIDKILFGKKDITTLPEDWRILLGDRKVVLYNTHLLNVVSYGHAFLDKMEKVIDWFKGHPEYLLWWRPHPLTEETISAMSPDCLRRYEDILAAYRKAKVGIYDDTPDLNRAILFSDLYYGSGSSLVALFGITGKPVIIQNEILQDRAPLDRFMQFRMSVMSGRNIYFVVDLAGILIRLDTENGKWFLESSLPAECCLGQGSGSRMYCMENQIYIFPSHLSAFFVYQMETKKIHRISLRQNDGTDAVSGSLLLPEYAGIIMNEQKFTFIPFAGNVITVYHVQTGRKEYFSKWKDNLERYMNEEDNTFQKIKVKSVCEVDGILYMIAAGRKKDVLCSVDLKENELVRTYQIAGENEQLWDMIQDGQTLWVQRLCCDKTILIRWNTESGKVEESEVFPDSGLHHRRMRKVHDRIYAWTLDGGMNFYYDIRKKKMFPDGNSYYFDMEFQAKNAAGAISVDRREVHLIGEDYQVREISVCCPEIFDTIVLNDGLVQKRMADMKYYNEKKYLMEDGVLLIWDYLEGMNHMQAESGKSFWESWDSEQMKKRYAEYFSIQKGGAGTGIMEYIAEALKQNR